MTALVALLMSLLGAGAGDFVSEFEQANRLYEQGKYAAAVAAYDRLIASGNVSAALYFNRGNAFFKMNQVGRAIASYLEAERLSPRDPDLRANLQFARDQVTGVTTGPGARWRRWLGHLTLNEWTLLTAGTVWLWFGLLGLAQWRPPLKRSLRGYKVAVALAAVLMSACLAVRLHDYCSNRSAIVIVREATVRQSPFEEAQSVYTARDGAELNVLDEKDDWFQVSDGKRHIGWVQRDEVLLLEQASRAASKP